MWGSKCAFVVACTCLSLVHMVLVVVDHDVVDDDVVAYGASVEFGKRSFQFLVIMLQN